MKSLIKKLGISKIKLFLKALMGREALLDYALDRANNLVNKLDGADKEKLGKIYTVGCLSLETMKSIAWLCPKKWRGAYNATVDAFDAVIGALVDTQVTREEIQTVSAKFVLAYSDWRAE